MKAWLVTWEWAGNKADDRMPIVSVLSPRLSIDTVRKHVEQLYADMSYDFDERLNFVKRRDKNPYPAEFIKIQIVVDKNGRKGPMNTGRITCGGDPHLYARKVADIEVKPDENGIDHLCWTEIPIPKSS